MIWNALGTMLFRIKKSSSNDVKKIIINKKELKYI